MDEIVLAPVHSAILRDDDSWLRQVSVDVTVFDDHLAGLAKRMFEVLRGRGVGLAAIQIGVPVRLIVTTVDGIERAMVNPRIVRKLNRFVTQREGCLSVDPVKWKPLPRPAKCDVEWQGLDGERYSGTFSNLEARAIMHEVDHLDDILITDLQATPCLPDP